MVSREERFREVFDRHHQRLLAYAIRRVVDPADAADVVAETFLVAWRRFDEVPAGDGTGPWLFAVARKVLANYYRGERRRVALADRLRAELSVQVDAAPEPEPVTRVERALDRIPERDRELLRLVAWEGLARDGIAIALGVPRATVRVRLHRARKRLLAAMDGIDDEHPARPGPAPSEVTHGRSGRVDALSGMEGQ